MSDVNELFAPAFEPRREREGLPTSYRMRADAHYVDELTGAAERSRLAGPIERPRAIVPVASVASSPFPMTALADCVSDIDGAAALLANDPSPMTRRVALDLVRAGSWRASWLVRGRALLDGANRADLRVRRLGDVLRSVVDGFAPESRLSGIALQASVPDWNLSVEVDEPLLVAGLTGAVVATVGLLGASEGAVITLMSGGGSGVTVDVAQDAVAMPATMADWFFDTDRQDRPGGAVAAFGAMVARIAARRHGGDAAFLPNEDGGTIVRLTIGERD